MAVSEVWRLALALLLDAIGDDAPFAELPLFAKVPRRHLEVARAMIARRLNTPLARGVGRYFDAVAALALARPRVSYEGQAAIELESAGGAFDGVVPYPFDVDETTVPWTIDLRPLARAVCRDVLAGIPVATISTRFHSALVSATADVVKRAARERGALPVVLGGGCFQNARLAEGVAHSLTPELQVYRNERVPPGDGGIALGQVAVADAVAGRS